MSKYIFLSFAVVTLQGALAFAQLCAPIVNPKFSNRQFGAASGVDVRDKAIDVYHGVAIMERRIPGYVDSGISAQKIVRYVLGVYREEWVESWGEMYNYKIEWYVPHN